MIISAMSISVLAKAPNVKVNPQLQRNGIITAENPKISMMNADGSQPDAVELY